MAEYVEYLDFLDNLQLMEGEDLIIWIKNVFSVSEKFPNLFLDPPILNQGLYTCALFKATQQVYVSPCVLFCPLAVVASHKQSGKVMSLNFIVLHQEDNYVNGPHTQFKSC